MVDSRSTEHIWGFAWDCQRDVETKTINIFCLPALKYSELELRGVFTPRNGLPNDVFT